MQIYHHWDLLLVSLEKSHVAQQPACQWCPKAVDQYGTHCLAFPWSLICLPVPKSSVRWFLSSWIMYGEENKIWSWTSLYWCHSSTTSWLCEVEIRLPSLNFCFLVPGMQGLSWKISGSFQSWILWPGMRAAPYCPSSLQYRDRVLICGGHVMVTVHLSVAWQWVCAVERVGYVVFPADTPFPTSLASVIKLLCIQTDSHSLGNPQEIPSICFWVIYTEPIIILFFEDPFTFVLKAYFKAYANEWD